MTLVATAGKSFLLGLSGAIMPGPVGLGYLVVAPRGRHRRLFIFYLFHILSEFVWYAFVSGAVTYGRRFLGDYSYRVPVGGCALFLLSFGIYFVCRVTG